MGSNRVLGAAADEPSLDAVGNKQDPASATDRWFLGTLIGLGGSYVLLIFVLVAATIAYTSPQQIASALSKPEIRYSFALSAISCTMTTILCLWVAIPLGYLMSRFATPL
ncbi:MAG: hypothetical protein AAF961_06255, partial [Planctomycetota bacterium]